MDPFVTFPLVAIAAVGLVVAVYASRRADRERELERRERLRAAAVRGSSR